MKELTKAEELVMTYLWELGTGYLKDIVDQYPEPGPAYTTVSTVVNVLVKKGFIGYQTHGKVREYYPLTSKSTYARQTFRGMLRSFFDDSPKQFVSFFTRESDLSISDLRELKAMIEQEIKKHQDDH